MSWFDRFIHRSRGQAGDEEPLDPEVARLVERARALPSEIEPERDLFLGIQHRITGRAPEPAPTAGWLLSLFPRPLAAASLGLVLVVTTALSVMWAMQPGQRTLSDRDVAQLAAELRTRDGVAHVHDSVVEILDRRREELPPEIVASIEANLRSIDRAIAEIHLALESNPGHQALNSMLAEAYGREADLLERLEWWAHVPGEVQS